MASQPKETNIYERNVITMEFDADKFNKKVLETTENLEDLRYAMEFDDVDYSDLEDEIDEVSVKFDALRVAAETAMYRIVNAALDAGKKLVKSLSIDNIMVGYSKYTQKVGAIQSMMATNADLSLEQITTQMEKLEWFTDETSYNLSAMQSAMSQFMTVGMSIEDATAAVQGIALWAAESGANAESASHAMMGLSKAFQRGYVDSQTWSYIVTSGMASEAVIKRMISAGQKLGKIGAEAVAGQFDELKTKKAFTTEVILEMLKGYSEFTDYVYENIDSYDTASEAIKELGESWQSALNPGEKFTVTALKAAQEAKTLSEAIDSIKTAVAGGYAQTFEYLIGDYTVAKERMTDLANILYNIFVDGSLNKALKEWTDKTKGKGQVKMWEGLLNVLRRVEKVVDSLRDGWTEIFGDFDVDNLSKIVDKFLEWSEALLADETRLRIIKFLGKSVINGLRVAWSIIKAIYDITSPLVNAIIDLGEAIGSLIADIFELDGGGDALTNELVNNITNIGEKIGAFIQHFIDSIKEFYKQLDDAVIKGTGKSIRDWLVELGKIVLDILRQLGKIFDILGDADLAHGDVSFLGEIFDVVGDAVSSGSKALIDFLPKLTPLLEDVLPALLRLLGDIIEPLNNLLAKVFNLLADVLEWITAHPLAASIIASFIIPMIGLFKYIWYFIRDFKDMVKGFAYVIEEIGDALWGVSLYLKKMGNAALLAQIKGIVLTLSILISAIAGLVTAANLTSEDPMGMMIAAGVIVGGLFVLIAALAITLDKLDTGGTFKIMKHSGDSFKDMAFRMVTPTGKIRTDSILGAISACLFGLAAFMAAISLIPEDRFGAAVIATTILVALLGLIAVCVTAIATNFSKDIVGKDTKADKVLRRVGTILRALSSVMMSFAAFFAVFAIPTMDVTRVASALIALGVLITILGGFMAGVIALSRFGDAAVLTRAALIIGMLNLFLASLTAMFAIFSIGIPGADGGMYYFIKNDRIELTLTATRNILELLIGFMTVIMVLSKKADPTSLSKVKWVILMLSGFITSITGYFAVMALDFIDYPHTVMAIIALTVVLGALAGLVILIGRFGKLDAINVTGKFAVLITLVKAIYKLIAAVVLLGKFADPVTALAVVPLITSILGAIIAMFIVVNKYSTLVYTGKAIKDMIALMVSVSILMGVIAVMVSEIKSTGASWLEYVGPGGMLAVLFTGLIFMMRALKQLTEVVNSKAWQFAVVVGAIVSLVASLALLMLGLSELSKNAGPEDVNVIMVSLLGIVGILAVIGMIVKALMSNTYTATALLAAIASIGVMALDFAALGGALMLLAMGLEKLGQVSASLTSVLGLSSPIMSTFNMLFGASALAIVAAPALTALAGSIMSFSLAVTALTRAIREFNNEANQSTVTQSAMTLGESIVSGFTKGMQNGDGWVRSIAGGLGNGALEAIRQIIDAHSPSKKTEELGVYFAEGFTKGIAESANSAETAAAYVGDASVNAMQDAIRKSMEVTDDGVGQLTIRPVMDLSNVQNGVNAINRLGKSINGYSFNGSYVPASNAYARASRVMGGSGAVDNSYNSNDTNIEVNVNGANSNDNQDLAERISKEIQSRVNSRARVWR